MGLFSFILSRAYAARQSRTLPSPIADPTWVQEPSRACGSLRIATIWECCATTRPRAVTAATSSLEEELSVRQIGTLPKGRDPQVFSDYLLTLGIKTRVDEQPESWNLWVYNEDQVPRASDELRNFLSRPEDPLYRESNQAAQAIRRQEQVLDKQFRKNFREVSDLWASPDLSPPPFDRRLVSICLVVFLFQHSAERRQVEHRLLFATTHSTPTATNATTDSRTSYTAKSGGWSHRSSCTGISCISCSTCGG